MNGPPASPPALPQVLPATGSTGAFGRSLLLVNGDLVFDGTGFAEISGLDNLRQALTLRILTPYGSDPVNTAYGLDVTQAFTQGLGRQMVKQLIQMNLIRTLASDPRVDEVRDVVFDDDPNFPGGPAPEAVHRSRLWRVAVTVQTATAGTSTLVLDVEA
jgi:hypothetical protein